jgi:hypothetical protein
MERHGNKLLPRIFVETEKKRWFRKPLKILRVFQSIDNYCAGYHTWVELPDAGLVRDSLSFQLDAWAKTIQEGMQS